MNNIDLKEILISARKSKNLSHEQVATMCGANISRQYYGMIENGDRRPSVEVAQAISKILDIKWTIFFENQCNQKFLNNNTV